jgi:putative addiction module component (TIGR02574 family)
MQIKETHTNDESGEPFFHCSEHCRNVTKSKLDRNGLSDEFDGMREGCYSVCMNMTAENIMREAMQLPSKQRAQVAEMLIESLDMDRQSEILSPEWINEIEKRMKSIDDGTATLIPAEMVFKNAFSRLP